MVKISALNQIGIVPPSRLLQFGEGRIEGMPGLVLFEKCFVMMNLQVFKFGQKYVLCGNILELRSSQSSLPTKYDA